MRNNQRPTTKRAPCLTEPCVQIPIRFESTTSNNAEQSYTASLRDEWQMLELQGNLSARPDKNKSLDGFNLGQLMPPNALNNNKCELVIGRQKCDGKQQEMKKPLVVLEKVVPSSTTDMSDNTSSSSSSFVHYRIVGVIRDKLHFANRPVPLSPSKSKNHQVNTTTISTSDSQSQSTTSSAVTSNDNNSSSSSTVAEDQQSKKTKQQQATKNIHPMFLPKKPQPQKKKQP